jgi:tripartite-type tricarboxylate transporter receptor subunit TctC
MNRRRSLVLLALAALAALAAPAVAQTWPEKPIRLIVTFPAGGGADYVGRAIAPGLTQALGQSVIVENRGGANGAIGNEAVAHAAPDGYTLLLGAAGPLTIAPHLEKLHFDVFKDLVPVGLVASSPFVLTVNPSVPAKSVAELTALAQKEPGKLNFGSSGTGGAPHLAGELYKTLTGVQIVHVPYKGLAPAITDLLGGRVQILFADVGLVASHVKGGTLRGLAVTSAQRSPALPDLPTMIEAGVPGYTAGSWYAVLAPAGTPAAIVNRVNAELTRIAASPEIRAQFEKQGLTPGGGTPQDFAKLMQDDSQKWGKLIRERGIKVE